MYDADIRELARIKYRCLTILPFSSLLFILTLAIYLFFRVKYINSSYTQTADVAEILNAWLYFAAELGILFPSLLNHFLRCLAVGGGSKAQHLRLLDNDPPRVDIFITCAGEDVETVMHTVEAACAINYPANRFRVLVLDDAGSEDLAGAVKELRETRDNLYYTARMKGKDHHFKAGNLNHGFEYVKSLPGGASDFIAALDADMIADPQWLRALMPHLLQNNKLALAQPPQRFYDVPSNDPLMQGLDVNFKITEPLKEMTGATWCGGSGYIIRRAALDDIGGFPTGSVGEDMYCSNVLLGKGWRAIYVDEVLQHGRVPESYKAHVKQQGRWHVGRVQTAINMRFYLWGEPSNKMTFRQRMMGLIYTVLSFSNISTTIALLIGPFTLLSGYPLVAYSTEDELRVLLRLVFVCMVSEWLDDCIVALITGYRIAMCEGHAAYWISPYHSVALVRALLPSWLEKKTFEFTSSGSDKSGMNERDSNARPPLSKRLLDSLWGSKVGFHVLYVIVCGIGVARSCAAAMGRSHDTTASLVIDLVTHVGWPPALWLVTVNSFFIPIRYAFLPPSIPNHSQLLKRDPVLRASYPQDVKEFDNQKGSLDLELVYSLCMAYGLGLFIYTWYM